MPIDSSFLGDRIRPILGAVRSSGIPVSPDRERPRRLLPFITISRQAWAGGWTLAQRLVAHLNLTETQEPPWSCWDRELVEKVAADHRISQPLIESLEDSSHSWLGDFLSGLCTQMEREYPTEQKVYCRVAATIRALAQVGHVVIVGRGGVFITHNMPGGIHVRLAAPLEWRTQHLMEMEGLSRVAAVEKIRETDRNREAFYKRYWPNEVRGLDAFTITLNTAAVSEAELVNCLLPLLRPAPVAS